MTAQAPKPDKCQVCKEVKGSGETLLILVRQRDAALTRAEAAEAEVARLRTAMEDCRLLAAKHRHEEWAVHVLRFCTKAGVLSSPLRNEQEP